MKNQKGNTSVIVTFIIVALVIVLVIYVLMNRNKEIDENLLEKKIPENQIENQIKTPTTTTQETTTKEQVTKTNKMEKIAKNGDTLVMNYTGKLVDGTVFDSNVLPKFGHVEPFKFTLGAGQVIKGWDEGLVGMKVGEKKILTIPPEKGYGSRAVSTIPANSTLIFDVELVGIE